MTQPTITLPHNFNPRPYQLPVLSWLDRGGKFAAIVWARRHGKDIVCWNYAIKRAASERLDVTYVYPTADMGKTNLWEAKTNDGMSFTDFIPMGLRMRKNATDDGLNDTYKQVELINGSIIRIVSGDNADRLRGANSKLYILSEFAEMDPGVLDVIIPVVEANGGQIVINFTPKGENHARGAWLAWQKDKSWFTQLITAYDTDVFTPEALERIRTQLIERFRNDGRSEIEAISYFEQEYLCSFDTPVIGSYFGDQLSKAEADNRIGNVPYEQGLQVHTAWDLGMGDSTSIWFFQLHGREVRIIDYYENSGEGLAHYIQLLQSKGYVYGDHYAPHDIAVRELGTGKSRLETARTLGINFTVAPGIGLEDGIDQARMLLSRCWFDETKTTRGLSALRSYHKDWDVKNKVFKDKPRHDWASHASDAFRYLAVGLKERFDHSELPTDDIPSYARIGGVGQTQQGPPAGSFAEKQRQRMMGN